MPLLLYTDRSPRAWATHKRNTLLGQAQNGARVGGADFTVVTSRPLRFPMTHVERVTWRVMRDVGVMRGAVPACMRHIMVKRRLVPSPQKEGGAEARPIYSGGLGSWPSRRPRPTITGWGTVTSPLPPSYKGAGSRLGRPAQPIQSSGAQGIRTDPLPQSAMARFPASTARHLHGGRGAGGQDRRDAWGDRSPPRAHGAWAP